MYRHHDHLHRTNKSFRRLTFRIVLLIPTGTTEKDDDQHGHHDPYLQYTLRNAQVDGAYIFVSYRLIDFAMMFFTEVKGLRKTVSRTEGPLTSILTTDNDRQRYAQMLTLIGGDVPLV